MLGRSLAAILLASAACSYYTPYGGDAADVTAPQIVSRSPAAGDLTAWSREPIRVVFSEPLERSSVAPGAVVVSDASGQVDATLALSTDGMTLTVTPKALKVPGPVLV